MKVHIKSRLNPLPRTEAISLCALCTMHYALCTMHYACSPRCPSSCRQASEITILSSLPSMIRAPLAVVKSPFVKSLTNQRTENSTFVYEYAMPSTKPRLGECMSFRPFLCNRRKASCPLPKGKSRYIEAETIIVIKGVDGSTRTNQLLFDECLSRVSSSRQILGLEASHKAARIRPPYDRLWVSSVEEGCSRNKDKCRLSYARVLRPRTRTCRS